MTTTEQIDPSLKPARARQTPALPCPAHRTLFICIILFGLVLWTFLPVINNDFVGYDDPGYITANDHVTQGLTWQSVKWAFRSTEAANWHPLTWLSHMLDVQLFGLAPWGHHFTSALLHACNALLAFLALRRLTGATWRSLGAALLFALHPLRVESVAWAAERKDILSTMFWMLSLLMYARYAQTKSRNAKPGSKTADAFNFRHSAFDYALALLFFCLGLMSKPMVVTIPCVLLLLDYWPLNRFRDPGLGKLILEKIPFFAASAVVSIVTFIVQSHSGAVIANLRLIPRIENALVSYCRYVVKLVWPVDLSVFYPYPAYWPAGIVVVALVLLAGVTLLAARWRRKYPWFLVGWFWFLGTLVPVIGIVQAGEQSMADRYSYVPSLGICLIAVWGLHALLEGRKYGRLAQATVLGLALVLCMGLTRRQVACWKDSETLFRHAIDVTQGNYVAYNNLGVALDNQGRHQEAVGQFGRALKFSIGNYLAHNNLGTALDRQGRYDEAIEQFQEAIREKPGYADAFKNLGIVYYEQGRPEDAIRQFKEALKFKPNYPEAHDAWGTVLEQQGRLDEAISEYKWALRLKPDYGDAHYNLGLVLGRSGRLDESIAEFKQALALQPNSVDACNNLGVTLERKGDVDGAIRAYREAVRLKPELPRAHFNLGVALCRKGALDQGIGEFHEALRLKPDYAEAQKNLEAAMSLQKSAAAPPAPAKP